MDVPIETKKKSIKTIFYRGKIPNLSIYKIFDTLFEYPIFDLKVF